MKVRFISLLLVVTLLMGIAGTSLAAAAAPPLPFGEVIVPLSEEEMEEIDGAWGQYAAVAVVSAAFAGATYWATTPPAERNWSDGLLVCAIGAMGALMGKYY